MTAYSQIKPQIVVSTFTAKISDKNFDQVLSILENMSEKSQVFVSGSQLSDYKPSFGKNIMYLKSIKQLQKLIA